MVLMIIIHQILRKGKPHCNTRSGHNTEAKQENGKWNNTETKQENGKWNNINFIYLYYCRFVLLHIVKSYKRII